MTTTEMESYRNSAVYQEALLNFQSGDWEPGLGKLNQLVKQFPLENELRALRQEMYLRSRIDDYEIEDRQRQRARNLVTGSIKVLIVLGLLALLFLGGRASYQWIQQKIVQRTALLVEQGKQLELAAKFRNAQVLMQSGKSDEAKALFEEIQKANPNYPGLDVYMKMLNKSSDLESQYAEAKRLFELGYMNDALAKLEELNALHPQYADVQQLIDTINRSNMLDGMLADANASFNANKYEESIDKYTSLRSLDPTYKAEIVEAQLYKSYLLASQSILDKPESVPEDLEKVNDYFSKALAIRPRDSAALAQQSTVVGALKERLFWNYVKSGESALVGKSDSLDALREAETYFQMALSYKPDDAEIQNQRMLATLYLQAQDNFTKGVWKDVIEELSQVTETNMDYANGTARQTLFEAYLALANDQMASSQFEDALTNYRRAEILARQDPEAVTRLFEIEVMYAEALGNTGAYQDAITVFQSAVEAADLKKVLAKDNPDIVQKIGDAERYTGWGNYMTAFKIYDQALKDMKIYSTTTHEVTSGEYINQIAREHGTTVSAIMRVNKFNSSVLKTGEEIIIPVLP